MSRSFRRKPLVWVEQNGMAQAGNYGVYRERRRFVTLYTDPATGVCYELGNKFRSEAEAKAAAEEHWQAQPPPEGYEEVGDE